MIPRVSEIFLSLYGAWRLACRDVHAIALFDTSREGVIRSFFAAAVLAPAYALMLAIRFAALSTPADPLRFALAEAIAYVVSWLAFPLAMVSITRALGRFERWGAFVCAYNWSLVIQGALVLPLTVLTGTGLIAPGIASLLWIPLIAFLIAYTWFIARTALEVPASTAFGIVGLDFVLSFVIDGIAHSLH